jgi:hypothetical protein
MDEPVGVISSAQGTDLITVNVDAPNVAVTVSTRHYGDPAVIAPEDARELAAILTEAARIAGHLPSHDQDLWCCATHAEEAGAV